ncbi:MAG TPA: hypothetical protein VF590_05100 [Isosphaeraceae bacterium]|jgi:hypothetical protein
MVSNTSKMILILTGVLAAILIAANLIVPNYSLLLVSSLVGLVYIAVSIAVLLTLPAPPATPPMS